MMMVIQYEGYKHKNGEIIVKLFQPEVGLYIDLSSPFIDKYLGVIRANSIEKAKEIFKEKQ